MNAVERLLKTLKDRGLTVKPGNEPDQLILSGPATERTNAVMDAVRAFKPQLLEMIAAGPVAEPEPEEGERCEVCRRVWYVAPQVRTPHDCDKSRCPYRTRGTT